MADIRCPNRRELLIASGALFAWAYAPKEVVAQGRDPRLLVIILRGALDGLAAVAPVGDPNWARLRGDAAVTLNGPVAAMPLNAFFALNPAMPNLYRLYKAGHATVVHAVATPYRERSHFDGQDVLESGHPSPGTSRTGWLNRALASLEPGERVTGRAGSAVSIGITAPLVVRGPANVVSWTPSVRPQARDDTLMRLLDLYRHTDPALAIAMEERIGLAGIVGAGPMRPGEPERATGNAERVRRYFAHTAGAAAKFLARPDGPRIGALSLEGWDTHANEGALDGRLSILLSGLDAAIEAVEREMKDAWRETAVAVVTEFGRTARINGTAGTDHGTGTVALLIGGALKGGRVITDWPGLSDAQLHQGRDLKPTLDLRAPLKGLLRDHVGVGGTALDTVVFPDSAVVRPLSGLVL
jgi:uncharacterized protein (DUF1501 family)